MTSHRPGDARGDSAAIPILACLAFIAAGLRMAGLLGPAPGTPRLPAQFVPIAGWVVVVVFTSFLAILVAARINPRLFDRRLRSREELDRH